jgi:hypothetical protein
MNALFTTLPQFELLRTEETSSGTKCSGVIKNVVTLEKAKPGWIVTIVAKDEFINGKLLEIHSESFQASIESSNLESKNYLRVGETYPLLDGYWGGLAELVLSPSIVWKKMRFEPHDSEALFPDGRVEIVEDGWDHEHCQICFQNISTFEEDEHFGYANQNDDWLCESCYQKYVVSKSLSFINLDQLF